jgi:hypothetical protein
MKKISLALVASSALLSVNLSADTIEETFKNGKVSGELKSQYFQKETSDKEVSIWTNGGNLSYETGSFNGLTAGVTFQVASTTAEDLDQSPSAYDGDQNVSGAIMSQAYLAYNRDNTSGKVGRQYISSPLIAGSGSRIFKQSFEGIVISNSDLQDTSLTATYVNKFQGRTDGNEGTPSFEKSVSAINYGSVDFDGAYSLYAKNSSVENLTLVGQYLHIDVKNDSNAKSFYGSASYNMSPLTISAQTYQSDTGAATNSDGSAYGLNIAANFDKLSLSAAISTIDDEADIVNGLGSGADYLYTWSWIYGGVYAADTDAYKFAAGYKLTNDLSFDIVYASWETGSDERASETDYIGTYNFNKNLSAKLLVATYDKLSTESYRSRLYVSYKF